MRAAILCVGADRSVRATRTIRKKDKALARPFRPAYTSLQMATDVEFAVSRIASVNPATGEVLGELDSAGPTEVRAAVARAHAAQPEWNAWGIRNRVQVLRRFQQILLTHKIDVARRITQEAGKPQVEALLTEVLVVLDAARFLIDNAFALLREEKLQHGNPVMKTKSGRIVHRAVWRHRHHLALELSFLDSGDGGSGRSGGGKRCGA